MQTFNQLTIRGAKPQLKRLLEAFEQPLAEGWKRDAAAESRLRGLGISGDRSLCFACTTRGSRLSAAVWLQPRGSDEFWVENIVPFGKRGLSDEEYNIILGEFASQVVQPASKDLVVETELTFNRVTPEEHLSPEASRRLKAFSTTANKTILHPNDCQRWHEFIVQSHLEGADFDPLLLDQWLTEQEWPEALRHNLVCEYETSRSILATYDEERLEKCLR